ncbi:MAG: hypothetical protein ABI895_10905, partial [Deltaproteobacteria bacterium]
MVSSPTDSSSDAVAPEPRARAAVRVQPAARLALVLVALCLLVPLVGILAQSESALEDFHTRRLHAWPQPTAFRQDPVQYLREVRDWLADRAFPIMASSRLSKRAAYFLLHDAPSPRITLGKEGHVFINGSDDQKIHWFFEAACLNAHLPPQVHRLERNLKEWARLARRRQLRVDVVVIPTSASIYADKLPVSVPAQYREACGRRTSGESPLLDVRGVGAVSFLYPLREMLAARGDPAFFPRGNWHPTGLSLQVVRNTYLARLGLPGPSEETLELGWAPAEALASYGIDQAEPTYFLHDPHVRADPAGAAELRRRIEDEFVGPVFVLHVFDNDRPPTTESVLMLSDSFGDLAAEAFAGGFRRLIQIDTNQLRPGYGQELVDRLQQFEPIQRIILLVREGGARRLAVLA